MSNTSLGQIKMAVGEMHASEIWMDILGNEEREIKITPDGYGMFPCASTSVSMWVNKNATGRDQLGKL